VLERENKQKNNYNKKDIIKITVEIINIDNSKITVELKVL
jgi:hypothetical protein